MHYKDSLHTCFADDFDLIRGGKEEPADVTNRLDEVATDLGMQISTEKPR